MDRAQSLYYIINHVFLPPKLPEKEDIDARQEFMLIKECEAALKSFQAYVPSIGSWRWAACTKMLSKILDMRDVSGDMTFEKVKVCLGLMVDRDVLAFHIRGQNAGLIIRKRLEQFSFESFELSPTTKYVMETKGRLQRCFPGPAVVINQDKMADHSFCEALAQLLTKLDINTPKEAWPVVSKAGSQTIEIRDSVHPKFVTEMLTGILRGIGRSLDIVRIHKRTRDDVLWRDAHADDLHVWYKSFMIFFMAHILQRAREADLPSDLLSVMVAKIAGRTLKLEISDKPLWLQHVHSIIKATQQELTNRWNALEDNQGHFVTQQDWDLKKLSRHHTRLSLVTLRPYLQSIAARETVPSDHRNFTPDCHQRIEQHHSLFPELSLLKMGADPVVRLSLADLELWVQDQLDGWLTMNIDRQSTCMMIANLIEHYNTLATSTYANNPQDISLMLLTLMDLWVAMDKCAIRHYPLLSKYSTEFPPSLLYPLLLPKSGQMKRLALVERYLAKRRSQAEPGFPSIFRDVNSAKSFAVQYFEQSPHHKALRSSIQIEAQDDRDRKRSELTQKQQIYRDLMRDSDAMECEFETYWKHGKFFHHSSHCQKCHLRSIANSLDITVHEWPLSQQDLEAKSAVFELDVPSSIARWRDTTYSLLVDTFSPPIPPSSPKEQKASRMDKFEGLHQYFNSGPARLQLASTTKSFVEAHYGKKHVPQATEDNICVNNGLRYAMYDSKSGQWTKTLLGRSDVQKICTFQLPHGSYKGLQFALDGTTHTPNSIIAMQSDCPKSLNLHEFHAFAVLRAGDRLQWRNIARELVPRVLNFSHEEINLLVTQAAWQVGRSGDGRPCRESHIDLEEQEFGISLLSVLDEVLAAVEGNWQGVVALRTFAVLAARLLSMSYYERVQNGCIIFLKRARKIALEWTRDVCQLFDNGQDGEELEALNLRILEMALSCHSTFDVDECYVSKILESNEDIATITECSITIYDRCPVAIDHLPWSTKMLLQRCRRLSHLLEPHVRRKILADQSGINSTVRRIWRGYQPGTCWAALETPSQRWLGTQTSDEDGYSPMTVHYNTLDGSLLVNGAPLTRLPQSYELHTTYRRLFGQKVLDVIPSTMVGMVFEARNEIFGQQVHFAMYGSELIIRTRRQKQICEVLPVHALKGDFPISFVEGYTHWLDISTRSVEWRPLKYSWASLPNNWQMWVDDQEAFILSNGMKELIDVRSHTAKTIAQILSPLEYATNIQIIMNRKTGALEVHLPRLKLDFFLKDQQHMLESKQFRGMVVDERQSFGAFTGLVNKLVLREIERPSRIVIVPYGRVSFTRKGHHVQVMIDTAPATYVTYHSYSIDSQLGRLVDSGSLQSRLFKLYLHATTSHCLIDQLTGKTGTEEALYGLAGKATRSFVKLEPIDIELLKMLAQLTPRRQFYPEHLQVMQQVDWEALPPLSQHYDFRKQVELIFDQARSFQVFQERPVQLPTLDSRGNQFLLERAAIRDSRFRVSDFGAEDFTIDYDAVYISRDQIIDSTREIRTCNIARLVSDWSTNLTICPKLLCEIESWGEAIQGPSLKDGLVIGFDLLWLDEPAKYLPNYWCTLHAFLSKSVVGRDKYKIMVFLSTLSYSPHAKQELIQTLLAFATIPGLRSMQLPASPVFHLAEGYQPVRQELTSLMEQYVRPFYECPERHLPTLPSEESYVADERRREQHQIAKERQIKEFIEELVVQWRNMNISTPTRVSYSTYILVDEAAENARIRFQSWNRNAQFRKFIHQVQLILKDTPPSSQPFQDYSFSLPVDRYIPKQGYLSFSDLIGNPAPSLPTAERRTFGEWIIRQGRKSTDQSKLEEILDHAMSSSTSAHERQYAKGLWKSFQALQRDVTTEPRLPSDLTTLLKSNRKRAQEYMIAVYQMICSQLQTGLCHLALTAQMVPRTSPISILAYLARDKVSLLSEDWKRTLIDYGLSITALQQIERLLASVGNMVELLSELENPGHQDWDPIQHPEWLLLEIESNILIRQEQAQISREMILPLSGQNSVMQLNMGLGKSSVIVPIVATTLADGTRFVRVIVLKPLAMQMFHLLVKKLGGMLNRRIYYMPISRSLRLDAHQARQIHDLYKECMQVGGILLLQPEHLLSFELMGPERLLSGDAELGNIMAQTQNWLRVNSRDILDESDEILSVRFELIYTIGTQRSIESSPDRWVIVEHVLGLLGRAACQLQMQCPTGLEVGPAQPGGFPRIRILQTPVGDKLLDLVADKLCEDGLPGMPVCYFSPEVRKALFRLLTDRKLNATGTELLREVAHSSKLMRNGLLLLRGLFAGGILRFALKQKRWRVNYGLDPSRTMLAVPYYAKDTPTARSEFSHPDATIVLTCLAYYYSGISDQQLHASFEALLQSDHAKEEYISWVKDAPTLDPAFKEISGVNLSNIEQCSQEVFPPLRFSRSVINFYLSTIVFPAEMKEFSHKLSSSGWDIAKEKVHPTTGFSGTNDSRYILPLSITQCDLPAQLSTNAAVLDCLLRAENSFVNASQFSPTGVLNAEVLLEMALNLRPPVRVIIDVGAQVLEWQNEEMVHQWLSRVPESEAQAAIFFDPQNERCVLSRDGTKELLRNSPFAKQIDQCLVYLDESHTRGTDLTMPSNYRAIVTLGPDLTKDRLAQACMRMRKLGKGQSVVFCSSIEIQRKICKRSGTCWDAIEVADVLKWCIAETNFHTRRSIPLWAAQGMRHQWREEVYTMSTAQSLSKELAESLLESEAQTLQQRYGEGETHHEEQLLSRSTRDGPRKEQLDAIRAKCENFQVTSFSTATLQEEQERELSPENEHEQQVELPPASLPLKHYVHPDVRLLITDGVLKRSSSAFQQAFETLRRTTAIDFYDSTAWRNDFLVTTDFANTIQAPDGQFLDSFLRPVHWVLSFRSQSTVDYVVLSPYEAQELLPSIRKSKFMTLHIYSPRSSLSVRTLEGLSFCAIPAVPKYLPDRNIIRHLNLFAGQLYIRDFEEYTMLCEFLGLCSRPPDDGVKVACDGFIRPDSESSLATVRACKFTTSPVAFLRIIMALRRKGQSFSSSHLGKILNGELIDGAEF
ncbi:hypothetical protein BGZ60DRAFT_562097 [Tricladium varicosporioides]|nr:hypothetical protein BGZ60DRAFT_562097 [Hymenoscyphus varicosporioides]